ncbi:hypothetical protein ACMGLI_17615 [Enterobacter hormaechei]|uniref:hypothetical protein n=1 Tax=Enterobacter hormaechei TaxID=158836 RepID=UPI002878E165|nr:hypothetical protein [Enterobacter hormaechei]MDS1985671.1 hypothetical protein [Enterobacter hormaechei]
MYKAIGGILAAAGVCWVGYALSMDVAVGYYDKVYNSGLLATRQVYALCGTGLAVIGTITVLAGIAIEKLEKLSKQNHEVMVSINNGMADYFDSKK